MNKTINKPRWHKPWIQRGKEQAGFWEVRLNGKYHRLDATDYESAAHAAHELAKTLDKEANKEVHPTVARILNNYLLDFERKVKQGTRKATSYDNAERYCYQFATGWTRRKPKGQIKHGRKVHDGYGEMPANEVKNSHIQDWINANKWPSQDTIRKAVSIIKAAFELAAKQGRIPHNPIHAVEGGDARDDVWLDNEWKLAEARFARLNKPFLKFFRAVRLTGARPGELAVAQPKHFQRFDEKPFLVLPPEAWKCGGKIKRGDKTRYIPLCADVAAECERAIEAGKEYLYTNREGTPWHRGSWVPNVRRAKLAIWKLHKKSLRPDFKTLRLYDLRGTFITHAVNRGVPIKIVAQATGTSVTMIERTYYRTTKEGLAAMAAMVQDHEEMVEIRIVG